MLLSIMLTLMASVHAMWPDHMRAYNAVRALRDGQKVLVASPAARTVEESRILFSEAAKHPGALAVGDLGPISQADAETVEKVRAFGAVRRVVVSCRTAMPHLGKARPRVAKGWTSACPDCATWMNWIGVMPLRPYDPLYVENEGWRAFLDFGTGPLGKDGARLLRPVFLSLGLGVPDYAERLLVDGAAPDRETYPKSVVIRWVFKDGLELVWRHGADVETGVTWLNNCGETISTTPSAPVPESRQRAALERGNGLPPEATAVTETILLGCCAMMTDRRVTFADCEKRYVRDGWDWGAL